MAVIRLPDRLNDKNWTPEDGNKRDMIGDCLLIVHNIDVRFNRFIILFLNYINNFYMKPCLFWSRK